MQQTIGSVNVTKVEVNKLNPRNIKKAEIKGSELFESIKLNGVQHPIEVRVVGDKFVLLSGERRLTCAKELKQPSIPAIIYTDMTDIEAYDKTHFENYAREQLNPLEQGVDAQNLMQIHKGDRKAVAAKLSLSDRELTMRLILNKLTKDWKDYLNSSKAGDQDDCHCASDLTIAHLELIARLSTENQKDMLENVRDWLGNWEGLVTVEDLDDYIQNKYLRLLSAAPWDTRTCEICKKRSDVSDQLGLWDGNEKDKKEKEAKCMDPACYIKKYEAYYDKVISDAKMAHKDLIIVSDRNMDAKYGKIVSRHDVKSCKKDAKGAKPALFLIEGKNKGIQYVVPADHMADGKATPLKSDKPKTMKERRETLRGLRTKIVLEKMIEELPNSSPISKYDKTEYLAAMICVFGGNGHGHTEDDKFDDVQQLVAGVKIKCFIDFGQKEKLMSLNECLWAKLIGNMKDAIRPRTGDDALEKEEIGRAVAELIGFDFDKAFKQAEKDKPEPKGWANLKEDGTPKA